MKRTVQFIPAATPEAILKETSWAQTLFTPLGVYKIKRFYNVEFDPGSG